MVDIILSPDELRSKLEIEGKLSWVKAYNRISALLDERSGRVLLVEEYGPNTLWWSEGWRAFHFPKTSKIVDEAYLVGNRTFIYLRPGHGQLDLIPTLAPIGIESLKVGDPQVNVTFAGIGGGGVSASYGRGLAKGVEKIILHEEGGGSKPGRGTLVLSSSYRLLLISVDDTDTVDEGATYATVTNIAEEASAYFSGIQYIVNVEANLFPNNPRKTKNCFASLAGFCLPPSQAEPVIEFFRHRLQHETKSDNTVMCSYQGFDVPEAISAFAERAKTSFVESVDDAIQIAKQSEVRVNYITGQQGLIGALAVLGLWNDPYRAVDISSFLT
jgi:methanogenesis imperfect marker protein 11